MKTKRLEDLGPFEDVDPDRLPKLPKIRCKRCNYCKLTHHATRELDGFVICAMCDYLELVVADSVDLRDAIQILRERCLCAYCGEPASDVEHVIPKISRLPTFTVPSCRECNLFAGGEVFSGFEAKAEYIRNKIRRRYRKVLAVPEWDEEELSDMGYNMRHSIETVQALKNVVVQRLEWRWIDAVLNKESTSAKTGEGI